MKQLITILALVFFGLMSWQDSTMAQSTPGTIPLDFTIPCPGGGQLTIKGTYGTLSSAIDAAISFENCRYIDSEETKSISGTTNLNGALPLTNGALNLSISTSGLSVTYSDEEANTRSVTCSGTLNVTGTVVNGQVNAQHSSQFNCQSSGSETMSMDELLNAILSAEYF